MKEDFLHYVWKFQKFDTSSLSTVHAESLRILHPGSHNFNSGPDFFNAKLVINEQIWAGNVELHLKASHWYKHRHESDDAYDNVILHVVWEHDADIIRKDASVIPTLEMRDLVQEETCNRYKNLFVKTEKWINCEHDFPDVPEIILKSWLDRLYIERLQQKARSIYKQLYELKNHWEVLLFRMLCKNFGLQVNGDVFLNMARNLDFSYVRKCSSHALELEALLFGQCGLFDEHKEDTYFADQKNRYHYLQRKFDLVSEPVLTPKYFRLRPPSFPTIRLSQLSVLYASRPQLFSDLMKAKSIETLYEILGVSANPYWDTHYRFCKPSAKRKKSLNRNFMNLLIINTVIPLKFCFFRRQGKEVSEELLSLAEHMPKEDNRIVRHFNNLRPCVQNAIESQAVLQLKKKYCDRKRCTRCALGIAILKDEKVPAIIQ